MPIHDPPWYLYPWFHPWSTQAIEQMVAAGVYNYVNPAHTTAVFGNNCAVTGNKPVTCKVVAFRIGRKATRQQAMRLRARMGFKPICIQHELALGAQHRNAQCELNWIVNPNDMVLVDDRQCVSYLYGSPAHRSLHLYNADYEWFDYTWFLGLLSE